MQLTRKHFIALAAALVAGSALAQGYPTKPITLVVPAAAGGTTDLAGRMLAQGLSTVTGQQVVVDNKGGGNGAIAASIVKRAPADGYTLLMQYSGFHVISPHLMKQRQWELADFQPIANILSAPQIIVVRDDVPARTLAELVAYAKANPGTLNYASSGNGSLQHVTGAMLEQQAGIKMTHVPYKGTGPALQDLLAGQVQLTFGTAPPFMQHIAAGKLRVLAVTGKERLPSLPDVPTTAEAGYPKLTPTSWFALFAPAAMPKDIATKLAADVQKVMADPAFKQKALEQGATADYQSPAQLGDKVKTDYTEWAKVIKASQIEAD